MEEVTRARTLGDTLFMALALPCPALFLSLGLTNKNLSQMLAATMLCPNVWNKATEVQHL